MSGQPCPYCATASMMHVPVPISYGDLIVGELADFAPLAAVEAETLLPYCDSTPDPAAPAPDPRGSCYDHPPVSYRIRASSPSAAPNRAQRRLLAQQAKATLRRAKAQVRATIGAETAQQMQRRQRATSPAASASYRRYLDAVLAILSKQ